MDTSGIRPGDIVEVDIKGRRFLAFWIEKEGQAIRVDPITPNITWRIAKSRDIKRSWRARKQRAQ